MERVSIEIAFRLALPRLVLMPAKMTIASDTEKPTDLAGCVAVVYGETMHLPTRRVLANGTDTVLLGEHGVILFDGQVV